MISDLIIRTDVGDFDLFGSEDIVQTFSIFNIEDISGRSSDYTNEFDLPLTNNNRKIIEFADLIPTINTFAYRRVPCEIIVSGLTFRKGFIVLNEIDETIRCRFFTGNASFYEKIKSIDLPGLAWDDLNHTWSLANAVAAANTSSGYIYPVIDMGEQVRTVNTIDVKKTLPCTHNKTILQKIMQWAGYTYSFGTTPTQFNRSITAYNKKNPVFTTDLINQSSYSAAIQYVDVNMPVLNLSRTGTGGVFYNLEYEIAGSTQIVFPFFSTPLTGNSSLFNFNNNNFTAATTGNYNYSFDIDPNYFLLPPSVTTGLGSSIFGIEGYLDIRLYKNGIRYDDPNIIGVVKTGTVALSQGDIFKCIVVYVTKFTHVRPTTFDSPFITVTRPNVILIYALNPNQKMSITLDANITFGSTIPYSSILPQINCSDWVRDMAIRFGWVLNVDEYLKHVTIISFNEILQSQPVDWSDKLDETNPPNIKFDFGNYAQNNYIKHKPDKSIVDEPFGTNYNLKIQNYNLPIDKELYVSPYAATELIDWNGDYTSYINIYKDGLFSLDAEPRILFLRPERKDFTYYAGVSSTLINDINFCYFIDFNEDFNMGFANNLFTKNSLILVNILQGSKRITNDFKLNLIDIKQLDLTKPVYVNQFQSLFLISQVLQYNYTKYQSTSVELIKLN